MKLTTQRALAQAIGIKESLLSRVKSGIRSASPELADVFSKMTNTDIRVWLFNTDNNISIREKSISKLITKTE